MLVESFPTRDPGPSSSDGRVDSQARLPHASAVDAVVKRPCPLQRARSPPVTKEPPRDWKGPPRDQSLPGTTGTQTRAGMGLSREDISRTRAHRGALCPFHPHFASLTASLDVALYGCHIAVLCAACPRRSVLGTSATVRPRAAGPATSPDTSLCALVCCIAAAAAGPGHLFCCSVPFAGHRPLASAGTCAQASDGGRRLAASPRQMG